MTGSSLDEPLLEAAEDGGSPTEEDAAPKRRRVKPKPKLEEEDDAAKEPEGDPDVPENMNRPSALVSKAQRLEARDHVLITAGPCLYLTADPQTYHGGRVIRGYEGRPFREVRELDSRSLCVDGPFKKPWLRVPKGGYLHPKLRKSTDRTVWGVHVSAWVLALFVAVYAVFFGGSPALLATGGVDFVGNVCGAGAGPWNPLLLKWPPSREWDNLTYLWFPIDPTAATVEAVRGLGLCVAECPSPDRRCAQDACQPAITQYAWDQTLQGKGLGDCCDERLPEPNAAAVRNYCVPDTNANLRDRVNSHCRRQLRVTYPSAPVHRLCVPDVWGDVWGSNGTADLPYAIAPEVRALMQSLRDEFPLLTDMWFQFTADMFGCKVVIGACLVVCFICGELYLYAIRISPFWVPWTSLVLSCAGAGSSSFLLFRYNSRLQAGEFGVDYDERKRHGHNVVALAWGIAVVAVFAALLGCRIRKRMDLGARMIAEANCALRESPGMAFVAPWTWLLQLCTSAAAVAVLSYVGSLHSVADAEGGWDTNFTDFGFTTPSYHLRSSRLQLSPARAPLMIFLIVVFLWTLGLTNAACYSVTAFICVHWYFSAAGDEKKPSKDAVSKATSALCCHFGSYSVAALILTLFEPVRGLLDSVQGRLRQFLEKVNDLHHLLRYLTCLAQVLLLLFDRFLKLVRRDAFVVQCIEGGSFMASALRAEELFTKHELRVKTLANVGDGAALCGRLSILSTTALATVILVTETPLGESASNAALIVFISVSTAWFVATLYGQIINASVDAFLMCFCYDMDVNDGSRKRPYFAHSKLKVLVDEHTEVRNDYRNIGGAETLLAGGLSGGISGVQALASSLAREAHRRVQDEADQRAKQLGRGGRVLADRTERVARETTARTKAAAKLAGTLAREGADAAASIAAGVAGEAMDTVRALDDNLRRVADDQLRRVVESPRMGSPLRSPTRSTASPLSPMSRSTGSPKARRW